MIIPVVAFLSAFAVAALIAPLIITALRKLKVGQKILEIGPKWHLKKQNIPTMGGFVFMLAALITVAASIPFLESDGVSATLTVLGTSLAFSAIGFLDDYQKIKKKRNMGLTAFQKSVLQIAIAIVFITLMRYFNFVTPRLVIPFVNVVWEIPWIVYNIIMAFIIVGAVNAVNITDGLDGLATGVTIPVMLFFAWLAWYLYGTGGKNGMLHLFVLATAMAGALGGFLIYNFNPARVIMGDTGSLFLGGMIVGLAFAVDLPVILVPIGLVYIVETMSVIIQVFYFKISGGKRVFKMAPIHHHFEMSGYNERQIMLTATLVTIVMCVVAYLGVIRL